MEEIKNCPLCGAAAIVIPSINRKQPKGYHVCCNQPIMQYNRKPCPMISGYEENKKVMWFATEEEAIGYWNRRVEKDGIQVH